MAKKQGPGAGKRQRGHVIRRAREREPQMVEPSKKVLLLKGNKAGPHGMDILRDIRRLRGAEDAVLFSRRNDVLPFEDETRMEFLTNKNDCGLFVLATHTKKRPNNLVFGRIFDNQTLDIIEVGVSDYTSFEETLKKTKVAKAMGGQTAVIFQGDEFDKSLQMQQLRSMLLDLFRDRQHEQIDLTALDHVVVCSAVGGKVYIRNYVLAYTSKAGASAGSEGAETKVGAVSILGQKIPNTKLIDMGPSIDMELRRTRLPASELLKLSLKQPKNAKSAPKKKKNISHDALDGKVGRIHMKKQDMQKLVTRNRFGKALKRSTTTADE